MKTALFAVLLLSACAIPGKPYQPQTLGECMTQRGDFGMSHNGTEGYESTYISLQACQAQMEMRK